MYISLELWVFRITIGIKDLCMCLCVWREWWGGGACEVGVGCVGGDGDGLCLCAVNITEKAHPDPDFFNVFLVVLARLLARLVTSWF